MITLHSTLPVTVLALATACWHEPKSQTPRPPDPNPTSGKLDVSIASVTLADDCNQPPTAMPPPMPAAKPMSEARSQSKTTPHAGASVAMADRACAQSSVQLRVANGTQDRSTIAIKKIELLDEAGNKMRDLQPRDPSLWADDGYVPWDQQIAPAAVLQVSYALSAPSASSGGTYTVRVTVATGDGSDRTIEQKLTLEAEASLPPGAVT